MGSALVENEVVWQPQPGPQKALVDCPLPEIFFGGSRGGGKTDSVLGKYAIKGETYRNAFNGVFFRRELPMLDDAIERSQEIFAAIGWKWNGQHKLWRAPHGARLRFRPLERLEDAAKYQGQNITDICVEEAGNYPDPAPIDRLHGVLRSAHRVPTQMILTGNPGGPGQSWIKGRYIDPAPHGMKVLNRLLPNGKIHKYVFIPSKLRDNKILLHNDPDYVNRLHLVGSTQLVKAWLEGDWNAVEGAYFDCFSMLQHVIRPFVIPKHWTRFTSFDWGSARPFSMGWWAVADGQIVANYEGRDFVPPAGALIRYREWYGASSPNVGLKLTAEQVAEGVILREGGDKINYRVADPACWKVDGGPSIAERMAKEPYRLYQRQADNSRLNGWDQMRARMLGDESVPMIYTFSTCTDSIRTIPLLQHDSTKPEDLDSDGEDHAADDWRYGCMSRPYTKKPAVIFPIQGMEALTMDKMWKDGRPKQRSGDRI